MDQPATLHPPLPKNSRCKAAPLARHAPARSRRRSWPAGVALERAAWCRMGPGSMALHGTGQHAVAWDQAAWRRMGPGGVASHGTGRRGVAWDRAAWRRRGPGSMASHGTGQNGVAWDWAAWRRFPQH
eukprot:349716-Chlamydomonas_euryale.AAC.1